MKETEGKSESQKKQQILAAASELFMRHGIRRISVEEICREAGVSKMTFYKYFENKIALALSLLKQIFDAAVKQYYSLMEQDIPYEEKAKQIVRLKLETSKDFSQEMMMDIWRSPFPEIQDFIKERTKQNFGLFLNDLMKAREKGEVRSDISPEFVLYILNHMVEMLDDERLTAMYSSTQELAIELTNFFFYGIIARNPEKGGKL